MNEDKIQKLKIDKTQKKRSGRFVGIIFTIALAITGIVIYYAIPRKSDSIRINLKGLKTLEARTNAVAQTGTNSPTQASRNPTNDYESVLTVSGYIVARERIELSPRFLGLVKWIGVKKGDYVTNGQIIVLLDDSEYVARLKETEARLESAKISLQKAQIDYDRTHRLVQAGAEVQKFEDDARLQLLAAKAAVNEVEKQIELIKTYLDWTVIRSPINGIVLEKLVDANELVTPQSFGGTRGPSTAMVGLADLNDLQVEIDLNESDLAKVYLNQKCKVAPEAYPDKIYDGYVAEIAPEANRQKGTLQVKVQVLKPDKFLIPELSAKVDFLK
ncbi:MAG: efflux RND transporter periplasmic adaptor subunit [Verrucomicrobiae bacterium]|nr:efflux RND transporter periplasmic adaptor subunit [Verrucomicrobiae bacterium]